MFKKNLKLARDFLIKNSKIAFPVVVIAAAAVTVSIALGVGKSDELQEELVVEETVDEQESEVLAPEEVQMESSTDPAVSELIQTYYQACADGNSEVLTTICDKLSEKEMLRLTELSKYISGYSTVEIYTKPGPEEGSVVAYTYYKVQFENHEEEIPGIVGHYVCRDEEGRLFIKRSDVSDEINDYLNALSKQEDVEELKNKVKVEYNELMTEHPELLEYLSELDKQVDNTVLMEIVEQNASEETESASDDNAEAQTEQTEQTGEEVVEETPEVENTVLYASATTTVNVRASDSEKADKLGKVSGGTQLQVLEQKENGWSKILYEGKEGFIKSEFLNLVDSAEGETSMGTVTAVTNVNVRAAASETADRLGVLAGGEKVDLLSKENGWCKIKYSGRVGYVKEEYVE